MAIRTALTRRSTHPPSLPRCAGALGLVILLAAAAPGEDARQPLPIHGFAAADAVHALVSISAGDADAVADLDPGLWHRGAAIPDHGDADLAVRWTRRIADALERCDGARRDAVLAAIERAAHADLAAHPGEPGRALDFLPAPSAVAALRLDSARRFDHGDFTAALSSGCLLSAPDLGDAGERRLAAARELCGLDERIAPALALAAPGEPVAASMTLPAPGAAAAQGLSVHWWVEPGWILALFSGEVIWQYRVDMDAEVVTGPGGALVRDRTGARLLLEDGTLVPLRSPPAGTRLLAVGGGAAWFATGTRAWRMAIRGGAVEALELGAEPECPPLVRGESSLWLLPDRIALFHRGERVASMRHHLAVGTGWRLCASLDGTPAVAASDGGAWRIEPIAEALARAAPIERARLQLAADHAQDALATLQAARALDQGAGRAVAFAAHVALGADHLRDHADEVAALANDPASRDMVLYTAWLLTQARARSTGSKATSELAAALAADPAARISWDVADLGRDEERCAHISTAAVLLRTLERSNPSVTALTATPLQDQRDAAPEAPARTLEDVEIQDPEFGHAHTWGDALIVLGHAHGETTLTCLDKSTRMLCWRTRWPSDEDTFSWALALRDGCAVVAEGTRRLIVVGLGTGSVLARLDCASVPLDPARACICGTTIVVPSPLDDALAVANAASVDPFAAAGRGAHDLAAHLVALPHRLRWLATMPPYSAVLADLDTDAALGFTEDPAHPDGLPLRLPRGIAGARQAPEETAEGLAGAGGSYSWDIARAGPGAR